MSRSHVAKALRQQGAAEARHRCGYCLTAARIVGTPMEIEHIIPESLGGPTARENLWLACSLCNDHKGNRIAGLDPLTEAVVRLFDPRRQIWTTRASANAIASAMTDWSARGAWGIPLVTDSSAAGAWDTPSVTDSSPADAWGTPPVTDWLWKRAVVTVIVTARSRRRARSTAAMTDWSCARPASTVRPTDW